MDITFSAPKGIGGSFVPPPDKSLTHRALMLASIAEGKSEIINPLFTGDCLSTVRCLNELGIETIVHDDANKDKKIINVAGAGIRGYREPIHVLDAGNSGTTIRLLSGLIAGLPIYSVLSGDDSLLRRPMDRVTDPLRCMGARIEGRKNASLAPLTFLPGKGELKAIKYNLTVASAQVKSSILFAALKAEGRTVITGKIASRDHTERMLKYLGIPIEVTDRDISLGMSSKKSLNLIPSFKMFVPGDISSASFFISAALLSRQTISIEECGINQSRIGFLDVLKRMGAKIEIREDRKEMGEPVGCIRAEPSDLKGIELDESDIPSMIDEIPLLAVVALGSKGVTVVHGAEELKHKESDRLESIASMVKAVGGRVELFEDGFAIEGPQNLNGGIVNSKGDHRIAMAGAVLSVLTKNPIKVVGFEVATVSYPSFVEDFVTLGGKAEMISKQGL